MVKLSNVRVYDRFEIVRSMGLAHKKIIDIGCNVGETFNDKATNVDIHSLEDKRKESGDPNLQIPNFLHANGESLPMIKDLEYDVAVLSEVLEHTEDPLKLLNEAQRIANIVIICVPNEYEWSPFHKPFQNADHKRNFIEETIIELIRQSELHLVEFMKLNYGGWSYFIAEGISKNVYEKR